MAVSQQTFEQLALEDPEGRWELHHGRLREKPGMTWAHNQLAVMLGFQLLQQLNQEVFHVRINLGRVRLSDETYYIPDVAVVPAEYSIPIRARQDTLEVYDRPLPFVAEVWSPSTGEYDVDAKLPGYQRRGDAEIWRLHPYERTVMVWRRQPDGSYAESMERGGSVDVASLPGVVIDLGRLFA